MIKIKELTIVNVMSLLLRLVIVRFLRFHRDETGVAYTVSLILLLPLFILMVVIFNELTLLFEAKQSVSYASFAAARTAAVVMNADFIDEVDGSPSDEAQEAINEPLRLGRVHHAAVNALAPFASGSQKHLPQKAMNRFEYPSEAPHAWSEGFNSLAPRPWDTKYLARKWTYAARCSRIRVDAFDPKTGDVLGQRQRKNSPNVYLRVTVEYEYPFHTPGAGRIFGVKTESGKYTRSIQATTEIPLECIKSADGSLPFKNYYQVPKYRSLNHDITSLQ
ncbi:MAG: hypothetical protein R3C28_26710 [Pirellulaceae bacterium]